MLPNYIPMLVTRMYLEHYFSAAGTYILHMVEYLTNEQTPSPTLYHTANLELSYNVHQPRQRQTTRNYTKMVLVVNFKLSSQCSPIE